MVLKPEKEDPVGLASDGRLVTGRLAGLLLHFKIRWLRRVAYSNSWQTGYYAYSTYSDCDTIKLPAPIHVRAYLYAETSRSIKKDSYPGSETRSACSYKSSYGVSLTPTKAHLIPESGSLRRPL